MKRKNHKSKKLSIEPAKVTSDQAQEQTLQTQAQSEHHDEAYRQINIVSFKKNFKALIGHYKSEDSSSR